MIDDNSHDNHHHSHHINHDILNSHDDQGLSRSIDHPPSLAALPQPPPLVGDYYDDDGDDGDDEDYDDSPFPGCASPATSTGWNDL